MITLLLETFYVLLPAYVANTTPVLANHLDLFPRLARPIDGGRKLFGEDIFGATKTWRGIILGIAAAMLIGIAQYFLWQFHIIQLHSLINFDRVDPLVYGLVGGMGAMGGDLLKSFCKRRFHIKSSQPWPIFDQLDFIIGYFVATSILILWDRYVFVAGISLTLILHPLTNLIAYWFRIKNVWW